MKRMAGLSLLAGLLLVVLVAASRCPHAHAADVISGERRASAEQSDWQFSSRLFGLRIDSRAEGEKARLVAEATGLTVCHCSELTHCEETRLALLAKQHPEPNFNMELLTAGGAQLWSDEFVHAGWRIQRHAWTGHCRVLDPYDVRRAWGPFAPCRLHIERLRVRSGMSWRSSHLVVLVHGLGRTRRSMATLAKRLRRVGYATIAVSYASSRGSLDDHAETLCTVLERSIGVETVSFVTHSLGGIVVRAALERDKSWRERIRAERVVMLAPPSQGAYLADFFGSFLPYRALTGEVGQDLQTRRLATLAAPDCEFGIVAGGTGGERGMNPLLPGDNDGVVLVQNARLEGAADFLLVERGHTFIMNAPEVLEATVNFLRLGRFGAESSGSEQRAQPDTSRRQTPGASETQTTESATQN